VILETLEFRKAGEEGEAFSGREMNP